MGTPCERRSVARMLRRWRFLRARISGSSVGPSTPQFQESLFDSPSRFSSPFARLCFSLYETRSLRVKPSWAVTKLTLALGAARPPEP